MACIYWRHHFSRILLISLLSHPTTFLFIFYSSHSTITAEKRGRHFQIQTSYYLDKSSKMANVNESSPYIIFQNYDNCNTRSSYFKTSHFIYLFNIWMSCCEAQYWKPKYISIPTKCPILLLVFEKSLLQKKKKIHSGHIPRHIKVCVWETELLHFLSSDRKSQHLL